MNPLLLANLIQGSMGVGQAFWGLTAGSKRPKYEIPQSARTALQTARLRTFDNNMPGESRARDQVNLQASNAIAAAGMSGNVLEALPSVTGQQEAGQRNISALAEQSQDKDEQELMQILSEMAQREDLQFQMNEFAPYAQKQQQKAQAFGAGMQNIIQALINSQGQDGGSNQKGWIGGDLGSSVSTIDNNFGMSSDPGGGLFSNLFGNLFGKK